jgi:hypothetical protein
MKYLNLNTFDITGDLSIDESLGSLKSEDYDHWIAKYFGILRVAYIMMSMLAYSLPVNMLTKTILV